MRRTWSSTAARVLAVALVLIGIAGAAGCDEEMSQEFREASLDTVSTGLKSVLTGLVDGAVAVLETDGDGEDDDS